jgi:hypothetical protein
VEVYAWDARPRVLVVLALLLGRARADCIVSGEEVTVTHVIVRPGLVVDVESVPVIATVHGKTTALEVGGAIAFAGIVKQKLWYTADREVADGDVTLARGAHMIADRADGSMLVGRAVLYANDVMQGEDKPADESISSVRLHCDSFTLDWIGDDSEPPALVSDDTVWRLRKGNSIVLRTQPSDSAPGVRISYPTCGDSSCIALAGIERRAGWIKVGEQSEGVTVTGWVRRSKLVRVPDDEAALGHSYGCFGDHGDRRFAMSFGPAPRLARLKVGTQIYAQPNSGVWAAVQQAVDVKVSFAPGEYWARIERLPNVEIVTGEAYVPVASLILAD